MSDVLAALAGPAAIALGIAVGTITGLVPGLHLNLVVFVLVSVSHALPVDPLAQCLFIMSMAVTQSYLDFIPAIFLGAPSGESAVAVFPGHRLVLQGRGPEAFAAAQAGGIAASIITTATVCAFFFLWPEFLRNANATISSFLGFVLAGFLLNFVVRERGKGDPSSGEESPARRMAMTVLVLVTLSQLSSVALSGCLLSFDTGIMATLTGLFGFPVLIDSLSSGDSSGQLPLQASSRIRWADVLRRWRHGLKGTLGGIVVGFLPGVGVGEVSALLVRDEGAPESQRRDDADLSYLATVGAVGTADAVASIAALFLLGKSRSGASVGIEKILRNFVDRLPQMPWLFVTLVVSGLAAGFASLYFGQSVANTAGAVCRRVRYRRLTLGVIVALTVFIGLSGGVYALLILVASTCIGLYVLAVRIRPTTLMAVMLIPVAEFFLGVRIPGFPLFPLPDASLWPASNPASIGLALLAGVLAAVLVYRFPLPRRASSRA